MYKFKLFILRIKELYLKKGPSWDRLSPSEEDAISFAYQHINDEPVRMLNEYIYSPEYVLAHYGDMVNTRLRENRADEDDLKIKNMISCHSADCDLVLYRGVQDRIFRLMSKNAQKLPDGDLFEKAFLPCSLVKGHEFNCAIKLRIFIPKGTSLVYLGDVNDEQYRYEVDVQCGALLKMISADKTYVNCILLKTSKI